jgi:Tfp pilus assembly protein PilV
MLTFSRRPRALPRSAARAGLGLVELVVAIMILSIGVLGLAGTAAYVTRQVNEGGSATYAAARVQTLMDSLRAAPCASLASGSIPASVGNRQIEQTWTITPGTNPTRARGVQIAVRWKTNRGLSRWQTFTMNRPCI